MPRIFDIKRYAIHDGPGIRTTIFFKGCPLSCVWCHNPEGISREKELLYTEKKCIACETCVQNCPSKALSLTSKGIQIETNLCHTCGTCADCCPTLSMEMSGEDRSIDWLMDEIQKETLVMEQSGGGITVCGGEPLLQHRALLALLRRCQAQGIHRAVDTTLFASPHIVREVAAHTSLFLVDIKHMNSAKHKEYTGVPNEQILENVHLLAAENADFIVRIPLIEGFNADQENIEASAAFLATLPWRRKQVELLPYHDIGKNKHEKRRTPYNPHQYPLGTPSESCIQKSIRAFSMLVIQAFV